ncbi:(deoxy)nucleoside triphosphate pyrophosphohydrolase [Ferrimonas aestuarii]|nr:(deoxy)nucleoside triphosphate pyrophosphohydrolase [Ferrimonas aestuarii]
MIDVCCGLIIDGDQILLARRHPEGSQGGLWEFAGGKQEPGESLAQALARELKEELCIDLSVGDYLGYSDHHYGDKSVRLHGFICPWLPQKIVLTGSHDRYQWQAITQVDTTTLAPADIPLLHRLQSQRMALT